MNGILEAWVPADCSDRDARMGDGRWAMGTSGSRITTRDRTRRGRRAPTGARAYLAKLYCHLLCAGVRAARAAQCNTNVMQYLEEMQGSRAGPAAG